MSKIDEPKYTKKDFDEKTKEPVIVEAKKTDLTAENDISQIKVRKQNPNANQIGLNEFFGVEKETDHRKMVFKKIITAVFIIFAVGVLLYTAITDFTQNELASASDISKIFSDNWYYLFLAFFSLFIFFLSKGFLRSVICRSVTGKYQLKTCMESGIVCQFYNYITPLAVGGQPFEISFLKKRNISISDSSSVTITTYLVNMLTYSLIYLFAIISYKANWVNFSQTTYGYFPDYIYVFAIVGTVLSLLMPVLVLICSVFPKLVAFLIRLVVWIIDKLKFTKNAKVLYYKTLRPVLINAKTIKRLIKKPLLIFVTFMLGFLEALAYLSVAFFILKFFEFNWVINGETNNFILTWIQVVTIVALINCAVSFIPTPGSSGASDFSFYTLFSKTLKAGFAFTAMFTWRIVVFYFVIFFGFIYIKIKIKRSN